VDCIPDHQSEVSSNRIPIAKVVFDDLISSLRIHLNSGSITVWQSANRSVNISDMFIGPFDLQSGASESHGIA
jgi:hypothetical protein